MLGDDVERRRRLVADDLSRQEREMSAGDRRPDPCPKCGNPSRLFTPNAQREPYLSPPRYEALARPQTLVARYGGIDEL